MVASFVRRNQRNYGVSVFVQLGKYAITRARFYEPDESDDDASTILFAKIASGHESVDVARAITFVVNTSKISADDVIRVCRYRTAYSV